ncbi:MAG: hypothetical protein A2033_14055 [Bacteroidetes bacterium GWA2_31_9]|nr:MAG: hypothetical protein A2033_14055 [Bacteroidetes bacterium GWA2_31_9]
MLSEKNRIKHSLIIPILLLITLWTIKLYEEVFGFSLIKYGLVPQKLSGIKGIFLSPLIHADYSHLISNSIPLFLFSFALFYFYRPISYKIFILSWFLTGLFVWFGIIPALNILKNNIHFINIREAYHIGSSGLVYSLGAFLFISGIIRKNFQLSALTLLVTFIYGSMIWGILPLKAEISWESHLYGLITGSVLAFYFRKHGPSDTKYDIEDDEEDDTSLEEDSELIQDTKNNSDVNNLHI